jgi:indolepyruvate ferredoxin oxidoreductase beta subunit
MKRDIIISGVGGQGILSLSALIVAAARGESLYVQQSEIHGMAQRGGAVVAHLRLSDHPIRSGLISNGEVDLILAMEPLEALRYVDQLSRDGMVLASSDPVVNMSTYPERSEWEAQFRRLPHAHLIPAGKLAKEAGSPLATNVVMVGAASSYLPLQPETLERVVHLVFERKGEKVVETNLRALALGQEAMECVPQ